jgi:hypothetical protein
MRRTPRIADEFEKVAPETSTAATLPAAWQSSTIINE